MKTLSFIIAFYFISISSHSQIDFKKLKGFEEELDTSKEAYGITNILSILKNNEIVQAKLKNDSSFAAFAQTATRIKSTKARSSDMSDRKVPEVYLDTLTAFETGTRVVMAEKVTMAEKLSSRSSEKKSTNINTNASKEVSTTNIDILVSPITTKLEFIKPSIYSLDKYLPYIGYQGASLNTCSAWAVAGMKSIEDKIEQKKTYSIKQSVEDFYSPSFIYTVAKSQCSDTDCTIGIDLIKALNVLKYEGVVNLKEWKYYKNDFVCPLPPIDKDVFEIAKKNKIKDYEEVEKNLFVFQYILSHNCPIGVDVYIDNDFIYKGYNGNYTKEKPFIWSRYGSSRSRKERKPHSMVCLGYNDSYGAFLMANSYGSNFGNNGLFWIDYDFMFNEILRYAYHINCNQYEISVKKDKENLEKVGNERISSKDKSYINLTLNKATSEFDLLWKCVDVKDDKDDQQLPYIYLQISTPTNAIIRKKVALVYGTATYFSFHGFNYFIELIKHVEPSNGVLSFFSSQPTFQISVAKIPINVKITK